MASRKKIKPSTIFASLVLAAAVLLSAWKGSLDWMAIAVFAVIMKLPGATALRNLFRGKGDDTCGN